jgi:hypothetical protein
VVAGRRAELALPGGTDAPAQSSSPTRKSMMPEHSTVLDRSWCWRPICGRWWWGVWAVSTPIPASMTLPVLRLGAGLHPAPSACAATAHCRCCGVAGPSAGATWRCETAGGAGLRDRRRTARRRLRRVAGRSGSHGGVTSAGRYLRSRVAAPNGVAHLCSIHHPCRGQTGGRRVRHSPLPPALPRRCPARRELNPSARLPSERGRPAVWTWPS